MYKNIFLKGTLLILPFLLMASELQAGEGDVKFRASTGQTYDDNITYARNNRIADFISTVTLGMDLNYEIAKTTAQISADLIQQFFWKYTENHNTAEKLAVRLNHDLTKHDHIRVSDSFSHAYEPISFDQEFTRISGRYGYYSNVFDMAYLKDLTEQWSVKFGYGNDVDTTSRSDLLDSYVNRFSLEGDYVFGSKSTVFGMYEYLNRKLDPGGNANINTLSGGMRRYLTGQLSIEGRAGIDFVDSYNGDKFINPLWVATLVDQTSEKESVNLSFTQRYSTSPSTDDVFNSWRLSGGVNRQLRKKIAGSASAFYGQGEYVSLNIKDNLVGINTALAYEISKNLKGNLSYTYSQTASNFNTREYRKNAVSLGISAEF